MATLHRAFRSVRDLASQAYSEGASLVERWKVIEQEMESAKELKNGPLKYEAQRRSSSIGYESPINQSQVNNAPDVDAVEYLQSRASNKSGTVQSMAEEKDGGTGTSPRSFDSDKAAIQETPGFGSMGLGPNEDRLAEYVKIHHKGRDDMRAMADRMACHNLAKQQYVANPQKLYTPQTKLWAKFRRGPISQVETQREANRAGETYRRITAPPEAALNDGKMTKLAAWSKSKYPVIPEARPPTKLSILTSKSNPSSSVPASGSTQESPSPSESSVPDSTGSNLYYSEYNPPTPSAQRLNRLNRMKNESMPCTHGNLSSVMLDPKLSHMENSTVSLK